MVEIFAIVGGIILALVLIFGWSCFEAWLGTMAINWICATLGIAFSITFWQTFVILFILNLIGKRFRSRTTVNK